MDAISALVRDELDMAVELRHRLHADPRISGDEEDTAEAVVKAIGGTAQRVAKTGRALRIGPPTGPAIVLRAELDGLPIEERSGVPWSSLGGVMHACGHDVHCAAITAVARAAQRVELPIGLLVLLQPREEQPPAGAVDVLTDDVFVAHQPRAVVGVHVQPQLPPRHVGLSAGPVNASCDVLTIDIIGRGGHSAYPHYAKDPILVLAQVITTLHHLVPRTVDPIHAAVLSVGEVHAGTAPNVIPPSARATATLRALDSEDRAALHSAVRTSIGAVAAAYGAQAEVDIRELGPAMNNHPDLTESIMNEVRDDQLVVSEFRSCGGDDFAYYSSHLPSVMMFVGTDGDVNAPGLHHPAFVPPDSAIEDVSMAYAAGIRGALAFLGCPPI